MVMNNAAIPAVTVLDRDELEWLFEASDVFLVAEDHGYVAGFVIVLGPGRDYGSDNYRWFSERYDDFLYVDRIVIGKRNRGRGIGQALYGHVLDQPEASQASVLLAEVNTRPRNDQSLKFHDEFGFVVVGEQTTEGGSKQVAMLERSLH